MGRASLFEGAWVRLLDPFGRWTEVVGGLCEL